MPDTAATTTSRRRSNLRNLLIDIAERRLAEGGLQALKARDLAAEAGCAVGAIYTVFEDMTALILAVNARTFTMLGAAVAGELARATATADMRPAAQMVIMGRAYHHFAAANLPRWRALFDVPLPAGQRPPDWYLAAMERLFDMIALPVAQVFADLSAADRKLLTRALFSSVHGIVFLALDQASAGVPHAETDRMIALLLERIAKPSGITPIVPE